MKELFYTLDSEIARIVIEGFMIKGFMIKGFMIKGFMIEEIT